MATPRLRMVSMFVYFGIPLLQQVAVSSTFNPASNNQQPTRSWSWGCSKHRSYFSPRLTGSLYMDTSSTVEFLCSKPFPNSAAKIHEICGGFKDVVSFPPIFWGRWFHLTIVLVSIWGGLAITFAYWFHVSKLARFPCCLPAMRKKIQKRVEKQVDHWTWNNLRCSSDMVCLKLKDIVK